MSVTLHTSLGDLKLELYCENVPGLCKNFLALCAMRKYDNTLFHRNIKGFCIQGGDPTGTGKKGKSFKDDFIPDEFHPKLRHSTRGIVSFASKGPDTNGSQFFILYAPQPHLDDVSSIFAKVIDGFDVLNAMEQVPVGQKHRPESPILLSYVTIHANPIAEQES